jgi:hypothetical protein
MTSLEDSAAAVGVEVDAIGNAKKKVIVVTRLANGTPRVLRGGSFFILIN